MSVDILGTNCDQFVTKLWEAAVVGYIIHNPEFRVVTHSSEAV